MNSPEARHVAYGPDQRGKYRVTAMMLDLQQILAGLAAGARKPQQERLIDHLAAARIT